MTDRLCRYTRPAPCPLSYASSAIGRWRALPRPLEPSGASGGILALKRNAAARDAVGAAKRYPVSGFCSAQLKLEDGGLRPTLGGAA